MLHPSYSELIDKINAESGSDENIVESRYSLVIAAAKRARQIVNDNQHNSDNGDKPLSVAVEELFAGDVNILPEEKAEEA